MRVELNREDRGLVEYLRGGSITIHLPDSNLAECTWQVAADVFVHDSYFGKKDDRDKHFMKVHDI